jgi:hypothetical protein
MIFRGEAPFPSLTQGWDSPMIEQVGQGRMVARPEQTAWSARRVGAVVAFVVLQVMRGGALTDQRALVVTPRSTTPTEQRDEIDLIHRREGEAILDLADAAMAGKSMPSDFPVEWQNEFVKAQRGTFVPFTVTVDASQLARPGGGGPIAPRLPLLMYVRAARRAAAPRDGDREKAKDDRPYPVDAIFPVDLQQDSGGKARISRGFSVLPGEYDVFVILRERVDPAVSRPRPRVSVLRQSLSVPDFWSNELTTSSVMLADRLTQLAEPVSGDQIAERPYAIGRNEIIPAADRRFRRNEELIVVFLVYNPMVTTERHFDVKVEYHFYRKAGSGQAGAAPPVTPHPAARPGETYFNHTDPQRFNPALMGAAFDPGGGEPVMAGQVVPLGGFQDGEYRLAVQVTDLLSGQSVSRDVLFTVGSF